MVESKSHFICVGLIFRGGTLGCRGVMSLVVGDFASFGMDPGAIWRGRGVGLSFYGV